MKVKNTVWVDSPNKPSEIDPAKAADGRKMAVKAWEWVDAHPQEFERLVHVIVTMKPKDHLRDRVNLACIQQGIYITDNAIPGVRFAHGMFAPMLRYAAMMHPEVELPMSTSAVDHSGLLEIPQIHGRK